MSTTHHNEGEARRMAANNPISAIMHMLSTWGNVAGKRFLFWFLGTLQNRWSVVILRPPRIFINTMKERPILFSGPMVRAILEGRKNQTRRLVRFSSEKSHSTLQKAVLKGGFIDFNLGSDFFPCPFGMRGYTLWVRETHAWVENGEDSGWVYRATDPDWETTDGWKWKPSIHMPKNASRITLKINELRIERLQDIGISDAIAEGIQSFRPVPGDGAPETVYRDHTQKNRWVKSPIESFHTLWDSIHGPDSWGKNPWVWVISFGFALPETPPEAPQHTAQEPTGPAAPLPS